MKKYYIHFKDAFQKTFLIEDYFNNSILYTAKRADYLIGNKFIMKDNNGEVKAEIKKEFSLIIPKYKIEISGLSPFSLEQELVFGTKYKVTGLPWNIRMDDNVQKYLVEDAHQQLICEIIKESGKIGTGYIVQVVSDSDALAGICIAIAIDSARRAVKK